MPIGGHTHLNRFLRVVGIVAVITAIRIYYLWLGHFPITFDEAQYWDWSTNWGMGYFSKPPMIAWLIGLFGTYCGDSVFCVKLGAPIMHACTALVVYLLALRLADFLTASWSAVIYLLLPGIAISSAFMSADVPLMFFWALSLLWFVRATQDGSEINWIIFGLICGLGLMSKYTMVLFAACILYYMLIEKSARSYFIQFGFWSAAVAALVTFSPNILWNFFNDFVSFAHVNENVLAEGDLQLDVMQMLEFIGAQIILFGPIMIGFFVYCCVPKKHALLNKLDGKLLIAFSLPVLLIAIVVSLVAEAQGHWAAPAYIAATIIATHYCLNQNKQVWLVASVGISIVLSVGFLNAPWVQQRFEISLNPFERFTKWNNLVVPASKALRQYPGALLVADERKSLTALQYQLRYEGKPYPVFKWNPKRTITDHYDMTMNVGDYVGYDMIFISRSRSLGDHLTPYFTYGRVIDEMQTKKDHFTVHYMENFLGY